MATQRLELTASRRTVTGKKVRFLRRQGKTPANIYGHGMDSLAVEVETVPMQQVLRSAGAASLVTLHLEGAREPFTVMVRDVQKNAISGALVHIDFYQVRMTELLRAEIPVHIVGTAPAVERGDGVLVHSLRTIEVEALPGDLPSAIEVDVSGLQEIRATVYVRDLQVPGNVTVISAPDEPVVSVSPSRTEAQEAAEAAPAEPERVAHERVEEAQP